MRPEPACKTKNRQPGSGPQSFDEPSGEPAGFAERSAAGSLVAAFELFHCLAACGRLKNRANMVGLWIRCCISTGSDVRKPRKEG